MKQQLQALLRKEISKQQAEQTLYKKLIKIYMAKSEKPDSVMFEHLNYYRSHARKVDSKLKKLCQLQKSLRKVNGFWFDEKIVDSQMNVINTRCEPDLLDFLEL